MNNKRDFGLVESLIVIAITALASLTAYMSFTKAKSSAELNEFKTAGLNTPDPTIGQIYKVMAIDKTVNYTVIAMPWGWKDDWETKTCRRFMLVVNTNINETGLWFVRDLAGNDNIVSEPVAPTNVPKFR